MLPVNKRGALESDLSCQFEGGTFGHLGAWQDLKSMLIVFKGVILY
jgi:hypothetical protein